MTDNKPMARRRGLLRAGSLLTIFAIFVSLSLVLNNRLFGHKINEPAATETTVRNNDDGSITVNTTVVGKDVAGYAGATPIEIVIRDGVVEDIRALPNDETPSFFSRAEEHIFPQWKGKRVADALTVRADACSGATYSSEALMENFRLGLQAVVADDSAVGAGESPFANVGWWCSIIVALCAAILPFFIHNRVYRLVQLALNVAVLGFWTGTFLSYTVIISLLSNSLRLSLLPVWILVAIAFVIPLIGKGNRYCTWVCPLGSLQQLAGTVIRHKPVLPHTVVTWLVWLRRVLWGVLVCLLWAGVGTQWIDYELFTAFMAGSAPTVTLCVAAAFVLLSLVVERPFCRFVCPMGCAIDMAHNDR